MILHAALKALPADARRPYTGRRAQLNRAMMLPDEHHGLPAGSCMHWLDIEKTAAGYVAALEADLLRTYGGFGFADDDARGVASRLDSTFFRDTPPPWPGSRLEKLWNSLPPTLPAFRAKYGELEVFVGTVAYQPYVYAIALSRALGSGDRYWVIRHAGNLAHFAGDLSVPFHLTADYKGQHTANLAFDDRERGDVHCRFETAFVKARLKMLTRELGRVKLVPRVLSADEITPAAIAVAKAAYLEINALLEADRSTCSRKDPRKNWEGYLEGVEPAFRRAAIGQLSSAAQMLADLLLTAQRGNIYPPSRRSANMKKP